MRSFASLRRRGDFARLRRHGRRIATRSLTIYRANAQGKQALVGISTGRAIGGAVTRNRVRRRILAIVDEISRGGDLPGRLLIEARPTAASLGFDKLKSELVDAVATP